MADGKIVIETLLDSKGIEQGLKELESNLKGLSGLSHMFGKLSKASSSFGKTFGALSSVMSSTVAVGVAGVGALVVAFNKLYEASKQNFFDNFKNIGSVLQPVINLFKNFTSEVIQTFASITDLDFSFGSLIAGAIEFESKMAQVSAIMNVTGKGINQLTDTARHWGASTRYTATQVAEAFTYMGMAGWSAQESIAGIGDILNIATVGATDLGVASDIVTDGLTALGMSANQAGNFCDYMSATITSSNTNVEMMGETLKYAGSVAGTLGISMKDLSVAIGLMAGAGVKASNSGTALRTLMSNLSAPTETVAGAMQKYGISLVTASDGSVDLDATLRTLRGSLKSLPLTEQAKACKDLAGKTGMTGLMAIVNATDAEYDKLSESIGNATETVSYFNENCASTGVTGEAATNKIRMLREAYEGSEVAAAALNLTTQDLALVVQTLGSHTEVTADNVGDLLNVFSKMKAPTEDQAKVMKKLGLTYHEVNDAQFDYSKTCATVDSSIIGLSQTQKEQVKSQLNTNMTMNDANKILKNYGLEAQSATTGQIDLIANMKELREKLGGMSEQARVAALEQLGLSSSIDEVNTVCNMSDEEFKLYCKNLELAKGLTEKLAQAMDKTTKGTLLQLSSAIEDVAITAFLLLKDTILKVTNSLNEFFETWRDADYSFEGFKKGLDGLLQSVKNMDLAGALGEAITGMTTFITGDGLSGILAIGSEIITKICTGIIQNKAKLNEAISSAIHQISSWVQANASQIGEAGKTILYAIKNGIEENKDSIQGALDAVAGVMNAWINGSGEIKAITGEFADVFVSSLVSSIANGFKNKVSELSSASWTVFSEMFSWPFNKLEEFLFPKAYACGKESGSNLAKGTVTGVDENGNYIYDSGSNAGTLAGQGVVEGAEEGVAPLTTVMQLESATQALQQSATNMYNGAKVSFQLLAEVGKQSMTDMYLGMQGSMLAVENSIKASATNAYLGASQSYSSLRDSATNSMISLKNVVTTQSNEARNAAMTAFVSLGNVINTQVSQARNAVTAQFISIKSVVSTQSTEARNLATAQFISLNKVIVTQFTEARNNATTQMISMKKVAQTQATEMRDLVTTQMISMHKVIVTQITESRNGFTTQMISMKKVASTQANEILSIFRHCASQMNSIGVNIGAGLRNGLSSQRGSIIATANSIANSVASTMRKALDIHSPSRVMKQIGVYTMEGYDLGMNAEYQQVKKNVDSNMNDIANRMKATVSMETAKVSANLSGNVSRTSTKSNDSDSGIVGILESIKNSIDSIDPSLNIDGKEFAIAITPHVSRELVRRRR
ncbi:phage tail tape measure protein [Paraclostridium bifermentans]|uniref:phage tail tape measure protein n=1 Tax=Paraclostridium bifermentans TaxID=1490 RepID=UPI0011DD27C0|nr:phage tail tape measure protein [Paraclostridium bifermentans]